MGGTYKKWENRENPEVSCVKARLVHSLMCPLFFKCQTNNSYFVKSGDQNITEVTDMTAGNIPSIEITIVAKPDDNGAIYKCTASNRATDTPLETFRKLTVHCKFMYWTTN